MIPIRDFRRGLLVLMSKDTSSDDGYKLRYSHEVELILGLHVVYVEQWTIAGLPLTSTDHAKLGRTATRHVVATLLQFHHLLATEAALPTFLLCRLQQVLDPFVLWALAPLVEFSVALCAYLCFALAADTKLATLLGAHMTRLDPCAAATRRAVYSVSRSVLAVFLIPQYLEFVVEQMLDVFERNVL